MKGNLSKTVSLFVVLVAYVTAIAGSILVLWYSGIENPIANMAVADFTATVIIFLFSLYYRNSSIYDPYWSVYPIFIVLWWSLEFGAEGNPIRNVLVLFLVVAWGARLTYNWARSWPGMIHQDWRYSKLARDTGSFYWVVSFLGIHLFPTVLVFLGCIPLFYIVQMATPVGLIDILAVALATGAIFMEALADNQLLDFKRTKATHGKDIMDTGLWAWSRHPNYFGEISFWAALFLFSLPEFLAGNFWLIAGATSMLLLFLLVSIPMMEKREMKKEGYAAYQKRVSRLLPLSPAKHHD